LLGKEGIFFGHRFRVNKIDGRANHDTYRVDRRNRARSIS
jgi:hypothetical protein